MATKAKKCIGTVMCLVCGAENPARENENGTLDLGCGYCDFVGYAKQGTEALSIVLASVNRKAVPEKPPGEIPKPAASAVSVVLSAENTTAISLEKEKPLTFVELLAGGRHAKP